MTTALADLHDWTRFDAAAAQMQASVEQYAGEHAAALRRHLGRTRATAALERGDLDGARTAFAASRDLETGASSPEETMDGYILDANIEAAARRFTRARSSLTLARGIAVPMGTSALSLAHLETICQLAINGPGAALAPARRLLDLLDGADARRFGTSPRFEFARRVGVLLHCHCQAFDDARRAFDLAAEALAARAPEMERCAKDAAASSPEDSDLVTAYRDRFAAERNSLAAEVVKLFRDAALNAVAMPSLSALAKGTAGLCAYCNGARLPDGSPIAFDALGSSGARTRIVHGRCGDCATRA